MRRKKTRIRTTRKRNGTLGRKTIARTRTRTRTRRRRKR